MPRTAGAGSRPSTVRPPPGGQLNNNKKGTAIDTNPTEDAAPVTIPYDDAPTPAPSSIQTNRASLTTWHAAITVAAAHAGTETHKPQLMGIRFTPANPTDPAARFTMTTTDAFTLARVTVTPHAEGMPTIDAVIPAKELAAAVAAAIKTHGKKNSSEIIATLTTNHTAQQWSFTTPTTSATGPTTDPAQYPQTDQLTQTLDQPSDGTAGYQPTGFDPELLTNTTNTARKIGAQLIDWHHWSSPTKPVAIRYSCNDVTADILLMPKRIHTTK